MKPYEKFKIYGAEALTEEELLGIIIRTGTKEKDSVQLAESILDLFPDKNLLGLHHCRWQDLLKIQGIGEVKAIKLKCIAELATRIAMTSAKERMRFDHPSTIAQYYMEAMRHEEQERVMLLMLDKKLHFMGDALISIGTVSESVLSPREIFIKALKENAVNIMLLHNHPSGDATPSKQDILITKQIRDASLLMNIPLLDHIIIGDNSYVSLKQSGYI